MEIVLSVTFVLASIGFLRKVGLNDIAAYGGALLAAVIVAELPQIYATFPLVAPWLQPIIAAVGTWVTVIGAPEMATRAVRTFNAATR